MACGWIRCPVIWAPGMRSWWRTPNSASSFTPTTWCRRPCASSDRGGLPRRLAHALELLADLGCHLLRARVSLQDAERREFRRDCGRFHRLLDGGHQRFARFLRNARRREEAEPDAEELL